MSKSNAYLFRHPFGVSITTFRFPDLRSNGFSLLSSFILPTSLPHQEYRVDRMRRFEELVRRRAKVREQILVSNLRAFQVLITRPHAGLLLRRKSSGGSYLPPLASLRGEQSYRPPRWSPP